MFTIGGSTGIILGNITVDIALHDTYFIVTHFHLVLSLGTILAILCGVIFFHDVVLDSQGCQGNLSCVPISISVVSRYHLFITFVGIILTFLPLHFHSFNVLPRRIPDFIDYCNSWNYLSSLGSIVILISLFIFVRIDPRDVEIRP
jgi:heme/copper-type cytochrome/quinol oxidase subunit 1